ncbi:Predicted ATPase with chaperone activity [Pseudomonas syringae pv. actinidiae]|uniref:Predicted ATPase with chaperone activity n=1 Tax=Pseudomonas syringae pv. actinidiae TaxID=103796 RepID=A0A2V0QC48_PSESF|nr:Predicted ATPase with chaperone activity [Pseudomonas syringae pv. actinidiae]
MAYPVFYPQPLDALEFTLVVGDDHEAKRAGMSCNHLIVRANRCTRSGQLGSDHAGVSRGGAIVGKQFKTRCKTFYNSKISFGTGRLFCAVNKLHQRDRADTQLPVMKVEGLTYRHRLVLDSEDANIGVEHVFEHQSDSRSCSTGCSRSAMKSSLTLSPSNQLFHISPAGEMMRVLPTATTSTRFTSSGNATAFGSRTA